MAIALLKEIMSVEETAEQKELEAQQKAREMIAAAKKEASDLMAEKEKAAEAEAGEIIKSYERKALADIDELRKKIQQECQNIREKSGRKLDKAADFIVGRIVKRSDR